MKRLLLLIVIAAAGLFPSTSYAQILIEQGKIRLDVMPGDTLTGTVTIHNTSEKERLELKAYWEDFEYVEPFDGSKQFMPKGTSLYSLSEWINFYPREITLFPKSKAEVKYSIKVPPDAQGGYYGVLFFENSPDKPEGDIGVRIVSRIGALFFVETKNKDKGINVTDFKSDSNTLKGTLANNGNIFMIPKGIYYILDHEGIAVNRGKVSKIYLPPKKITTFELESLASLKPGHYTAVITFDLEDGDSVIREIDFEKDNQNTLNIKKVRN